MKKNELTNRRLVSALTVGISAMMALATPITAYANGEPTAPVDDNPGPATESNTSSQAESAPAVTEPAEAQAEVVQEAVAAEPKQAETTEAASEQLQSAAVETETVANEILSADTGAKETEAGAVANTEIKEVIDAANAIVNGDESDPAALTSLADAAAKAGEVRQVLDDAGQADKKADQHEAEMISEAKNVSDNVNEATKKADDMVKDTEETQKKADALMKSINDASSVEDANKAYADLEKLVDDTKFNLEALQKFYDGLLENYNEAKGKLLEAEKNMQNAEIEFEGKINSADQKTQEAQQDIADAKEKVEKLANALDKVEDKLSDAADVEGLKKASGNNWSGKLPGDIGKRRGVMRSVVENYYLTQKLNIDLVRGEGYETTWQFIKEGTDNDEGLYSIDKQEYNYAKLTYYYKDDDGKIVQGTKYFNWDSIEKQYKGNWQNNANATSGDVIVVYEKTQDEYEANKLLNEKYKDIIKNTSALRNKVNKGEMDVYVYENADGAKEYIAIDDVNKMIEDGAITKDADGKMVMNSSGSQLKLVVQNQNNLFHNADCLVVGSNERINYYAYDSGSPVSGILSQMLGERLDDIVKESARFNEFINNGTTTDKKNAAALSGKYANFDTATYKAEQAVAIAQQEAEKLSDAIDELKGQKRSRLAVDVLGVEDVASHFGIEVDEAEAARLNEMTVMQVLDELDKLLVESNKKVDIAQNNLDKLKQDFGQAKTDLDTALRRLNPVRPVTVQVSADVANAAAQTAAANAANVAAVTGAPAAAIADAAGNVQQEVAPVVVDQRRAARQASADALVAGAEAAAEDEIATIEDDGVALAQNVEVKTAEVQEEENKASAVIEDEDTAKGLLEEGPIKEDKIGFWWLLVIAILGESGREMYVRHKKKQEEKARIDE